MRTRAHLCENGPRLPPAVRRFDGRAAVAPEELVSTIAPFAGAFSARREWTTVHHRVEGRAATRSWRRYRPA